ncbi:ABC transporter ATP-binding protein [Streptomyces sp. NPDC005481]|uniref:ABC transporter ATP-binding protein n=1 Tax=Streptomyces sp. NPDC005481 TaxID=3154881 RepID=UPI00339DD38C
MSTSSRATGPSGAYPATDPAEESGTFSAAEASGVSGAIGATGASGASDAAGASGAAASEAAGASGASVAGFLAPPHGTRLTLTGAALGRPGAPVLEDVGLDVAPGEILTVVGPSGCGKSTLLRTLAGLLPALAGTVTEDGRPLVAPSADRALVFQEDALLPWRTLRANIELPLAIQGSSRADRRSQADAWLARVGLGDRARHLPHRVSGGQRQRVQLARALAGRPRAVLMDEPFGALDAQTRAGMQDLLVEVLHGTGATVVFVTHDVDEALFLGDRVALLGSTRAGGGDTGGSGTAGGLLAVRPVPRPRERSAHDDPARLALRREVLTSLGN